MFLSPLDGKKGNWFKLKLLKHKPNTTNEKYGHGYLVVANYIQLSTCKIILMTQQRSWPWYHWNAEMGSIEG